MMNQRIPIEVSARHIHLSQKDLEALFGKNYKLKKLRQLTQPCDFAAEETVNLKVNSKILKNIRIVGPTRDKTQVEISMTDAINLGINPCIRNSGDIKGTPGAILISPKKKIVFKEGIIIAARHIHCATNEAKELGLKNGMVVSVKIDGKRGIIFNNVLIRVKDDYKLCLHLDTDEGNAAGIDKKGKGLLLKP